MMFEVIKKFGYKVSERIGLKPQYFDLATTYVSFFEKSENESFEIYIALVYLSTGYWEGGEYDYGYYIVSLPSNKLLPLEIQQKIDEEIKNIKKNINEVLK